MTKPFDKIRCAATALQHVVIERNACVYCGDHSIKPVRQSNGNTRHLDHFVPVHVIAKARELHPTRQFPNWLLPCCPHCNVSLGRYYFETFTDKFEFICDRRGSVRQWPNEQLRAIEAPDQLRAIIKPMNFFQSHDYIIQCPFRSAKGVWITDQRAERFISRSENQGINPSLRVSLSVPRQVPGTSPNVSATLVILEGISRERRTL
jgi:hypothetical protein